MVLKHFLQEEETIISVSWHRLEILGSLAATFIGGNLCSSSSAAVEPYQVRHALQLLKVLRYRDYNQPKPFLPEQRQDSDSSILKTLLIPSFLKKEWLGIQGAQAQFIKFSVLYLKVSVIIDR